MKTRHIRKLRKKIAASYYYIKRYEALLDSLKIWKHYYDFNCDSFFVGYEKAQYNMAIYSKNVPRIRKKAEWYRKKITDVPLINCPL